MSENNAVEPKSIVTDEEARRIIKISDEVEVYIKDPSRQVREQAEIERARAYTKAIASNMLTVAKMEELLVNNGIWSQEQDLEAQEIQQEIIDKYDALDAGGIKKSEGRQIAIDILNLRRKYSRLVANKSDMLSNTVEQYADNIQFNYLVSQCAVYNDTRRNKQYFKDFDDYLNRQDNLDTLIIARKTSEVLRGLPDLDDTPEQQFLKDYGFVNDDLRFINEDGHLTDIDGRLIDENGNYIKYLDGTDTPIIVDKDGNEIKERVRKPFLDDDGKPIILEKETTVESAPAEDLTASADDISVAKTKEVPKKSAPKKPKPEPATKKYNSL